MSNFIETSPENFDQNIFNMLSKDWALLTASNGEKVNTMTVSWGGAGVLWNKNVCFIFVRPQRYTEEILKTSEKFTLSFFGPEHKETLKLCGAKSGRDTDKIKECSLTCTNDNNAIYFEEASTVIVCKKLYKQHFSPECIIEQDIDKNYSQKDYHYMYIGEIKKILIK